MAKDKNKMKYTEPNSAFASGKLTGKVGGKKVTTYGSRDHANRAFQRRAKKIKNG